MRKAFSFAEVLISIAVLAFLGVALIKFNAFNKRVMERNILSERHLLLSSNILYAKEIDNEREVELIEFSSLKTLHDDDREFLRDIKIKVNKEEGDKIFLGSTGENDLFIEYGDLDITLDGYTQKFLWMQKDEQAPKEIE